jgi:hypothetical protein
VEAVTAIAESLQLATLPDAVGLAVGLVEGLAVGLVDGFAVVDGLVVGVEVGDALGPAAFDEPSPPRPVSSQRTPRSSARSTTSTTARRNQ